MLLPAPSPAGGMDPWHCFFHHPHTTYSTPSQPQGWALLHQHCLCHEDFLCAVNAAWTIPSYLSNTINTGGKTNWYWGTNVRQGNYICRNGSLSENKLRQRKTASKKNSRVQWDMCRNTTSTTSIRSTFIIHLLCARNLGIQKYIRHSTWMWSEIRMNNVPDISMAYYWNLYILNPTLFFK